MKAEASCDSSGDLRKEADRSPPFPGSCSNEAARCSRLGELITRSPERRKWETKPNLENPSSAAPGDGRPRPLCICVSCAVLWGCGASGHHAAGTHMRPRPPLAIPASPRTRHSGASCCGLRLAACHAMEHPPADTQGAAAAELRTRTLQTGCPDSPLPSQVLTLACTHPEAEGAEQQPLELRVLGSDQQGRRRGPGLALRSTGGSGPGAARGARLQRGSLGSVVPAARGGHAEAGPQPQQQLALFPMRWSRWVLP